MYKYIVRTSSSIAILFIWMQCSGFGQLTGGVFAGTVVDPTDAVIPDVTITVTNMATGVSVTCVTTREGIFRSPTILPGTYTLTADRTGFQRTVFGPATLEVNQIMRVPFVLGVGTASETVTVTSSPAQLVQTESSELSQVIQGQAVTRLPLNGRDWKQLILLNAAANTGSPAEGLAGANFVLQGQRSQANSFLIDGIPAVEGALHLTYGAIPLEAVAEFSIQQSGYSAEWGDVAGSVLNVQTKSGANTYHGSAFEFLRNDALDARSFFANATGSEPDIYKYNQFGASLGGPVRRNRSFFFGDYQGTRLRQAQPAVSTVPLAAERTGDFSASVDSAGNPVRIYDPFSSTRAAFAGNVIPNDRIDPVAKKLVAAIPMPNQFANGLPLRFNNYVSMPRTATDGNAFDLRFDYTESAHSYWFFRNSYQKIESNVASAFGPPLGGSATGLNPFRGKRNWTINNTALGVTYLIRPHLINEFRTGLHRTIVELLGENYGKSTSEEFGIPGVNHDQNTSGLPYMQVQGVFDLGDSLVTPQREADTNWLVSDIVAWTKGSHATSLGLDFARDLTNGFSAIYPRGFYVFERTMTGSLADVAAGRPTGSALASFLVGAPTVVLRDALPGTIGLRSWRLGVYAQDNFKASSRLSLNLGLRYDVLPAYREVRNRLSNFDLDSRTMQVAGDGVPAGLRNTNLNDWSPRVGFAYSLTNDRNTVLRGAYSLGRMNLLNNPSLTLSLGINPPFYNVQNITQNPFAIPAVTLNRELPAIPISPAAQPQGNVAHVDPNAPNSYTQNWHVGVQRGITRSIIAEAAYIGSSGVHLVWPVNINAAPPGVGDRTLRRPFGARFGAITDYKAAGHSTYHGLQTKIEHRFSDGLYLLGGYVFSKAIDNQSTGVESTTADNQGRLPPNPRNLAAEKALASFDHRHRLVVSGVWDIPFARSALSNGGLTRTLFGGWQLGAIYSIQSGAPFSAVMACSNVNGDGNCRPNRLRDGNLPGDDRTPQRWFDTSAFAAPATPAYGNAGRDILIGPKFSNLDCSLSRTFNVSETTRFQFRSEFFNALNHTNFDQPVNSMDSMAFGSITSAANPRLIQFALRFEF